MVKTHKNSKFVLLTLDEIRKSNDIVLQVEDSGVKFESGFKCFLCETVAPIWYNNIKNEDDLINEICTQNQIIRRLEKKIARLEKERENDACKKNN